MISFIMRRRGDMTRKTLNIGIGPDDDMVMFTWDRDNHHLEIEVYDDGHLELFYMDKDTEDCISACSDALSVGNNLTCVTVAI